MSETQTYRAKEEELIVNGMELLWQKGYHATSVNDIVKSANVPKGSFYFYFKSKEDFTLKAIDFYFNSEYAMALEILTNPHISPKQRLLNYFQFMSESLLEEDKGCSGCLACKLASEMAEHNEPIRLLLDEKRQIMTTHLTEVIKEAQASGEVKNELKPYNLAVFILDAGRGAMVTMKEMKDPFPIKNFTKMVEYLLI